MALSFFPPSFFSFLLAISDELLGLSNYLNWRRSIAHGIFFYVLVKERSIMVWNGVHASALR